ncbi:MAG: hypothetical protein AAB401_08420 [Acidobacteriota bacterium]
MPDENAPSPKPKEAQPEEVLKTLAESLFKGDETRKRATITVFTTAVALAVKEVGGLSSVSWTLVVIAGMVASLVIATVQDWVKSRQPATVFYLCPVEQKFIPIRRSSPPIYRKMKSCSCGCKLIKKCQQGKHQILSTDPDNPDAFPKADECCQHCDPALPKSKRTYLPETASRLDKEPSRQVVG